MALMTLVSMSLLNSPCSPLYSLAFSTSMVPMLCSPLPQLPLKGVLSSHSQSPANLLPLNLAGQGVNVAHLYVQVVMV